MVTITHIDTPLGQMTAGAIDEGICMFEFADPRRLEIISKRLATELQTTVEEGTHRHLDALKQQMGEYFAGTLKVFDLPLYLIGSDFQKKVWNGLLTIPYGKTRSYKEQSIFLGDVKAIRAVGTANGQNSIAIIVPCHRVIGADGSLTGYGGGLHNKKWLLEHEAKHSGKGVQDRLFS